MTKHPYKAHGQVTRTIYSLVGTNHISGTAEARVVKFCQQVGYARFQHTDGKSPLKASWSGSHDPFSISTPAIVSAERLKRVA